MPTHYPTALVIIFCKKESYELLLAYARRSPATGTGSKSGGSVQERLEGGLQDGYFDHVNPVAPALSPDRASGILHLLPLDEVFFKYHSLMIAQAHLALTRAQKL
jgi:hypothetical protein